jgi:hypothetical protein
MASTVARVQQIIDTEQTDAVIQAFLDAALVHINAATDSGDLTASQKNEIQAWLAAHMLAVTHDRQGKKEKLGDAQVEYTGEYKQRLASTTYGQMVLTLDTSGKIGTAAKKAVVLKAISEEDD